MRQIIGLIGLSMMGLSSMTYFVGYKAGICLGIFIFAAGLVVDAIKK